MIPCRAQELTSTNSCAVSILLPLKCLWAGRKRPGNIPVYAAHFKGQHSVPDNAEDAPLQDAMALFDRARAASQGWVAISHLPSEVLADILVNLALEGEGEDINAVLNAMWLANRHVPKQAYLTDEDGRTFISIWLQVRFAWCNDCHASAACMK